MIRGWIQWNFKANATKGYEYMSGCTGFSVSPQFLCSTYMYIALFHFLQNSEVHQSACPGRCFGCGGQSVRQSLQGPEVMRYTVESKGYN